MTNRRRAAYLPTPEELEQRCREIQRGWTTNERVKRSVVRLHRWSPPTVRVADMGFGHENRGSIG